MKRYWMGAAWVVAVLLMLVLCDAVWAAALTANRSTPHRTGEQVGFNVASGQVIYAGAIVAVSNGLAYPATDVAGRIVAGRAESYVDNSGAAYKATNWVVVSRGVFRWVNGGSLTDADVGSFAYVEDDQTVTTAADASADLIAGTIIDVDADGVWVDTYAIAVQGAATLATLAVEGNASVGGTLGVTGLATLTGNGAANELDTRTATALLLGKATATSVTLGATDANTSVAGALAVAGASTLSGGAASATNRIGAQTVGVYTNGVLDGWFVRSGADMQYVYAPSGVTTFTNTVISDVTQ